MDKSISISIDKNSVKPAEAAALYIELGWGTAREYSVARMRRSLAHCDIVVSARNVDGELVGIGRALSDFAIDTKILDLIYFETERKNFAFAAKCGYKKRGGLTVFRKKG